MRSHTLIFLIWLTFFNGLSSVAYGSTKNKDYGFSPCFVRAALAMTGDNVEVFKDETSSMHLCDKNLVDERWGMSLLHLAALHGHKNIAAYLVSKGLDKNAKACSGQTPYDVARMGCKWAVTKVLTGDKELDFEHNENYLEDEKKSRITILKEEIEHGLWDNVQELITLAGPDCRLSLHQPLLHAAVAQGSQAKVIQLLEAGAHPNLRDSQGNTPLHVAVMNDAYIIARILLAKKGVKLSLRNNHRHDVVTVLRRKLIQNPSKRFSVLLEQICGSMRSQYGARSNSFYDEKPVPATIVARINKNDSEC